MFLNADLSQTLKSIPWFIDLSQPQLERLASIATLHGLEPNEVLFKEGDREDLLYVLLEGQVVLDVEVPTKGCVPFYTAEALDILGWSSMTPIVRQRTASAVATKRSILLSINSKLLQQICDEDFEIGYIVMRRLANVVANRLLTARLCLLDLIAHTTPQTTAIS